MGVATQSSQRRHVRVSEVQLKSLSMALLDSFLCLHLLLALASAQWWGLRSGFQPRAPTVDISPVGRFGAQRGIGVAKQPAAGYFRASTSNFFRGSSNYGSRRFGPRPASVSFESSDDNRLTRNISSSKSEGQLTSPPSKSASPNDVVSSRTSKKASDGLLGVEQKKEVEKENVSTRGWVVPTSLKALPAVPGSVPLKQPKSKTPDQMTDVSQTEEGNPYEKFMPVPAVPNSAANLQQASRKPKDSLASVDLNVSQLNIVAAASKASTPPPRPTNPPRPAAAVPQQSLSSDKEDKQEIRKKFKRCHGRCVQKQCLPVGNLDVYYKCVDKCKQLCTP